MHNQTPEMLGNADLAMYQQRIGDSEHLALVATYEAKVVAFKLGYAKSANTFYSWLGAVDPQHRGKGIAKALLLAQEKWACERGYTQIEVKTMLRFDAMLAMLRSHGYIQKTKNEAITAHSKIHFYKLLEPNKHELL
ncbi:GNAT family N-acetyltransferase [Pseudoalteromonas sp. SSDWG2]|uniref:GNAT family N-acetyltransferase n=1 Tax=Pseudoalteromonas sp. SSDWG2 TaxID=3139391 RepID=UPI003BAB13FB